MEITKELIRNYFLSLPNDRNFKYLIVDEYHLCTDHYVTHVRINGIRDTFIIDKHKLNEWRIIENRNKNLDLLIRV